VTLGEEGVRAPVGTPALVAFGCPSCGWSGEFDSRFTQWCEKCGFNADPAPPDSETRWAARRKQRARARAQRLCDQLAAAQDLRPTSMTGVAVTAVSTLVHLATLGLVIASFVVIKTWSATYWWAWALGGFGILVAIAVRPQLWRALRAPKGLEESALTRETAPALFALLERCAAQLHAPVPDYVVMNGAFNAATRNFGLRRRRLLTIGVPLWTVLTGPQRVALLGHELGHHVNRDVTHGVWASTARRSLNEWVKLFNPNESRRERIARRRIASSGPIGALAALFVPVAIVVVCGPLFLLAMACYGWLTRLDLRSGQRAEHLADELGARLGSSSAAVALTERLALAESVGYFLRLQRSARSTEDPWPALRAYLDSIPDHEKRRRILLDQRRGTRIDATHPANHLRRELLMSRPQLPGTVTVDEAQWAAIDGELSKHYAAVAHSLRGSR
jgi:Zn-dependent protease with chaperone function